MDENTYCRRYSLYLQSQGLPLDTKAEWTVMVRYNGWISERWAEFRQEKGYSCHVLPHEEFDAWMTEKVKGGNDSAATT